MAFGEFCRGLGRTRMRVLEVMSPNKPRQPTPDGAGISAFAVHVTSPTRQSLGRGVYPFMKYPALNFVFLAILVGCSKPEITAITTAPASYPILVIDEDHRMRGQETPPPYRITSAGGIRLDATQFRFTSGTNNHTPNMVKLFADKAVYRLSHPTETNFYTIDTTSMEGAPGEKFQGFHSGSRVVLFIGRSMRRSGAEDFWISWAGHLEVK